MVMVVVRVMVRMMVVRSTQVQVDVGAHCGRAGERIVRRHTLVAEGVALDHPGVAKHVTLHHLRGVRGVHKERTIPDTHQPPISMLRPLSRLSPRRSRRLAYPGIAEHVTLHRDRIAKHVRRSGLQYGARHHAWHHTNLNCRGCERHPTRGIRERAQPHMTEPR